jgi:catechol-2,3-dioxygenase
VDISHLHLHVRDRGQARDFYRRWFGLDVVREGDELTFLSGSAGFLLALAEDADPPAPPPWFHFGIRMASKDALRDLHARMAQASVGFAKPLYEDATFMSFRCRDPDGYAIEVYWENA